MDFEKGRLYYYTEFFNNKILNIFLIKAISFEDDIYRFELQHENSNIFYNIHKDCFPVHIWKTDKNAKRKTQITKVK